MIIKMNKATLGSEDGLKTMLYQKDKEYEINTGLADAFLKMGVAEKVKMINPVENKMVTPTSNKAIKEEEDDKKGKNKRKKIKDLK